MNDIGAFEEREFPRFRIPTIDTLDLGSKKHHIPSPKFPFPRSTVVSTVVLLLALSITRFTFAYQRFEQISAGNLCGVSRNESCIVLVLSAGWPLPYMVDQLGTSAMGVLGFEDLMIVTLIVDLVFFALLLGGLAAMLNRLGFGGLLRVSSAISIGALTGIVLYSAATRPGVMAGMVNYGIILGGGGALLALCVTLYLWHEMARPFLRTLLSNLLAVALPGLLCGLFTGGLFGILLQPG